MTKGETPQTPFAYICITRQIFIIMSIAVANSSVSNVLLSADQFWTEKTYNAVVSRLPYYMRNNYDKIGDGMERAVLALRKSFKVGMTELDCIKIAVTAAKNAGIDTNRREKTIKRKALEEAYSIDTPIGGGENSRTIGDLIPENAGMLSFERHTAAKNNAMWYINSLPQNQRKALTLLIEGNSYNEIAEALKKPLATIKTWINRGRKNLENTPLGGDL